MPRLGTARRALPCRSSDSEQVSRIVATTRQSSAAQRYVQTTLRYASLSAVGFTRGTTPLERMHERLWRSRRRTDAVIGAWAVLLSLRAGMENRPRGHGCVQAMRYRLGREVCVLRTSAKRGAITSAVLAALFGPWTSQNHKAGSRSQSCTPSPRHTRTQVVVLTINLARS